MKLLQINKWSAFLLILLLSLVSACQGDGDTSGQESVDIPETKRVPVPKFERDSAYNYVAKQVSFGPRVPNTEAHRKCKEWLLGKLKSFGADVIEQDFQAEAYTGTVLNGTNIIAQFNPEATKRVLLAAHWDTRHIADSPLSTERKEEPILGADDGGSGVGVLLEVARNLQENPIEMGVDIVFFDAEDHGRDRPNDAPARTQAQAVADQATWCLGAQHWARNLHKPGYDPKYGILLDMVGTEDAKFTKEGVSMAFAPGLMNKVWKLANQMGYGNYFLDQRSGEVTDDHYFVNRIAKIPMIDIINKSDDRPTGFGQHWHTHNDNMDIISKRTLRAVGQLTLAVVYRENNGTF